MTRRAFLASGAAAAQSAPPPNIIWMWADNLAYQDLGCFGSKLVKTPNIDRLAAAGIRLTEYYVAHTVCSPSRAALLTGRQPFRAGIVDVLRPDSPSGLPGDEITLGTLLRRRGYRTQAIGKWHLGDKRRYLPLNHGFDHYFGMPYSMDMAPSHLYRDNEILEDLAGDRVATVTQRYTDEAIRFITAGGGKPFFLYFSHTIPHPPIVLPAEARKSDSVYNDAIEHMDQQVGRLLRALDEAGLASNTVVFFSSDNGPMAQGGQTGGLRGRIRDAYEGGVRVPFMARWPGKIRAGTSSATPAIAYDIFPTIARIAGAQVPADRVYDGQDILPQLTGGSAPERKQPFFWVYTDRVTAVRDGNWKLHVGNRDQVLDQPELYDLAVDPAESSNLAAVRPEIVARLSARITEFQAQVPKVWRLDYPVRDRRKLPSGQRRK